MRLDKRSLALVVLLLISTGVVGRGDDKPAVPVPQPNLIADPNWVPNPGDRAEVTKVEAYACPDLSLYNRYLASVKANDSVGLARFTRLPKGTPVLILRGFRPEKTPAESRTMSTDGYLRAVQAHMLRPIPNYSDLPVEVRILDGPANGKTAVVPESAIMPLIQPDATGYTHVDGPGFGERRFVPFPPVPGTAGSSPEIRAANLLRVGLKAERTGDVARAIACFHRLMHDMPNQSEAQTASRRLDAMGVRRLPDGNYVYDPAIHIRLKRNAPRVGSESSGPTDLADSTKRAATLITMAKNLEALKKVPAALDLYRQIVRDYRDTPQAREAEARIRALGPK